MAEDTEIYLDTKNLDALVKVLQENKSYIKVGIIGNKAARDGNVDNATVGASHEFGTSKMEQRSFLRMPLNEKLSGYLENSDLDGEVLLKKMVAEKGLMFFLKKIATLAERVITDAFTTQGWGQWAKWKNPKYKNKTGMVLQNTTQLRESISTEIV